MTLHEWAEVLSLGLTIPAVVLSLYVLWYWREEAAVAIRNHKLRTPVDWLILGVLISFAGSVVDNLYWGVAWLSSFMGWESKAFWFENGVYSNIPFRQVALMAASYCHLRSAFSAIKGKEVKGVFLLSLMAGLVSMVVLLAVR